MKIKELREELEKIVRKALEYKPSKEGKENERYFK